MSRAVSFRDGASADEAEIQRFAAARLSDFKVPRRVFALDAMGRQPAAAPPQSVRNGSPGDTARGRRYAHGARGRRGQAQVHDLHRLLAHIVAIELLMPNMKCGRELCHHRFVQSIVRKRQRELEVLPELRRQALTM